MNYKESVSWGLMMALALLLIIIGFQGSLGRVLACIFTPNQLVVSGE